jgi:hypothetical protein
LETNRRALQSLYEGIERGRLQFSELSSCAQINSDSEFVFKLGELARLLLIRYRLLLADRDPLAAAGEVVRAIRVGEMICNGGGQVLHYLIGLWTRSAALRGIQRLAGRGDAPPAVLELLDSAVKRHLAAPDGLADCLRADFCCISLPRLDLTPESDDLESFVDQFLDLHLVERNGLAKHAEPAAARQAFSRPADTRREQLLELLQGHPKPFDKMATVRLMSSRVAESIRRIGYAEKPRVLDVVGRARQVRKFLRQRKVDQQIAFWPAHLTPGFPAEEVDQGVRATRGAVALAPADLGAVRKKVRSVTNPIGLLLAEHLLAPDYSQFMFEYRVKLEETERLLAERRA